jgi:hypothetical protein
MGKVVKLSLIANLCLWVYLWISFALASEPFRPRPLGHYPVDPYTYWGHTIGLTRSSLTYPFMKVAFCVESPSFLLVALVQHALPNRIIYERIVGGISMRGHELLIVMLLSFLQWYIVGRVIEKIWGKRVTRLRRV